MFCNVGTLIGCLSSFKLGIILPQKRWKLGDNMKKDTKNFLEIACVIDNVKSPGSKRFKRKNEHEWDGSEI